MRTLISDDNLVGKGRVIMLTPKEFRPGEIVIYQDFGLRSFLVERVLSWDEYEESFWDRLPPAPPVVASATHVLSLPTPGPPDYDEDVFTELISAAFYRWDFNWMDPIGANMYRPGKRGFHHYSCVFHDLDGLIEREARVLYAYILDAMLDGLARHPSLCILEEFGILGERIKKRM